MNGRMGVFPYCESETHSEGQGECEDSGEGMADFSVDKGESPSVSKWTEVRSEAAAESPKLGAVRGVPE
jgi:hypothetical protein